MSAGTMPTPTKGRPSTGDAREALDGIRGRLVEPPSIAYFLDEETLTYLEESLGRELADARQDFETLRSYARTVRPFSTRLRFEQGIRALERRVDDLEERKVAEADLRRQCRHAEDERARAAEFDLAIGGEDSPSPEEQAIGELERLVQGQKDVLARVSRDAEHAATFAHLSLDKATSNIGGGPHGRLLRDRSRETRPRVRRTAARRAGGVRSGQDPGSDEPPGARPASHERADVRDLHVDHSLAAREAVWP